MKGPDFICIGMPKAATSWLYDQLRTHPDFWLPPVKEFTYLNRAAPAMQNAVNRLLKWQEILSSRKSQAAAEPGAIDAWPERRQMRDERDLLFLQRVSAISGKPMSFGRYARLFWLKGDKLSGDISPGYCTLEGDVIEELARALPNTKILLLVRDPVARAWSRICMSHRDGKFDAALLDDVDRFRAFLERSRKIQGRSHPTAIFQRWQRRAPAQEFKVFLFDDIVADPRKARRKILRYLGANPHAEGILPADHNPKAQLEKLDMTDRAREVLIDYFKEEILACAATFGGRAREWPARYGL